MSTMSSSEFEKWNKKSLEHKAGAIFLELQLIKDTITAVEQKAGLLFYEIADSEEKQS